MDGLLLLSVLLAQGLTAPANAALEIDASLAFGAYVSGEGFSEIHVRAVSSTGGILRIETAGAAPTVSVDLELQPNQPRDTWLPVYIESSASPLSLSATLNQSSRQEVALQYSPRSLPRFALLGPQAIQRLSHLPDTEAMIAADLPHLSETYQQISALAIDSRAMAALDENQLRSLLEYVGTCGRVLLIDASAAIARAFVNRAACEGRFLGLLANNDNAEHTFLSLIAQTDAPLPSERNLAGLLSGSSIEALYGTRLALFLGAYLVVLIVLLSRSQSRFAAPGFSLVAAFLVWVAWPAATSRDFVAWAEIASTEQVARYRSIERYSATRRETVMLSAHSFDGYTRKISGENYSLDWSAESGQRRIAWNATPFQSLDRITHGSFPVNTTLRLNQDADTASVCNTGVSSTTPMYLHWQGDLYAIPPLAAGMAWSSMNQVPLGPDADSRPELRLFLARSAPHPLTVLQSLSIPHAGKNEHAWLLRYQSHENRRTPCAS
ncbi:MAG: hypothetical protein GXP15_03735 [Gammaproteobacteria bacterium]|nr:hypothetical protein [Gammaproteobacteria bacterium]